MSGPFALVRRIGRQIRARLLERLLDHFLECPDGVSAERLVATRRRLTGDDALALLTTGETATRELGDHLAADGYEYHRLLLERCRREGPDRLAHLAAVLTDRYIHEGQDLLDEAVELGRARLLSAALRHEDADVQRLRDDHPDLARRFRRAAAQVRDLQNGLVRDG